MTKLLKGTKVKAFDITPLIRSTVAVNAIDNGHILNPNERKSPDQKLKNGLSRPSRRYKVATLNCRTLQTLLAKVELNKVLHDKSIHITCIQEHRLVHKDADPDSVAHNLGSSTLFTFRH